LRSAFFDQPLYRNRQPAESFKAAANHATRLHAAALQRVWMAAGRDGVGSPLGFGLTILICPGVTVIAVCWFGAGNCPNAEMSGLRIHLR
jgi:hypothetical protein